MRNEPWILPEGIDEVLPPHAWRLESVRRELLDLYVTWGYDLVIPPFVEYLESLLTGTGGDLDLQTFKLTDQMSGRLMGIRADMTPQAARIDAHRLRRESPTRLCYIGTVLHTLPGALSSSRSPMQVGVELYGHSGVESDLEVLQLMMLTLEHVGVEEVYLDLGHVGIFRGLAKQATLTAQQESDLFDALQRKAVPEIQKLIAGYGVDPAMERMLTVLAELNGEDALDRARVELAEASEEVMSALDYLQEVAEMVAKRMPALPIHFDLAELRGYHYKTGVVFAAFAPGLGEELARGGRYDGIGRIFGRERPAVGFSSDLKTLLKVRQAQGVQREAERIYAPWTDDSALRQRVDEMRRQGHVVVSALPGQTGGAAEMGCGRELVQQGDGWVLTRV
ncbi:MAG TPA: ATP phosphoribosyltransferase regulatory subunit [Chromatiales bacterium]|nr:ATP phosphoribosyltransferase regulatory subunit [Chromatiales bacterium]